MDKFIFSSIDTAKMKFLSIREVNEKSFAKNRYPDTKGIMFDVILTLSDQGINHQI